MSTLSEAAVHAIEGALDRDVDVLLVDLAVRAGVLRVAQARPVITPSRIPTVVGARLHAAVLATPPRLAPAGSVEAEAVVGAVVDACWD